MLSIQVHALQTQLATAQSKQQEAESKDLLMYIRSMPESQLRSLSEGMYKYYLYHINSSRLCYPRLCAHIMQLCFVK
jgi:hypothetical protein